MRHDVVQEAFEHVDRPRFVADYLLERLRSGGILIFDLVKWEVPDIREDPRRRDVGAVAPPGPLHRRECAAILEYACVWLQQPCRAAEPYGLKRILPDEMKG